MEITQEPCLGKNLSKKIESIEVHFQDASWEKDELGRKAYADQLTSIIQEIDYSFTVALYAPWGGGKSFFLNAWKKDLKAKKIPCVYFSAWEYEHDLEPLSALAGCIKTEFSVASATATTKEANAFTNTCIKLNQVFDNIISIKTAVRFGLATGQDIVGSVFKNVAHEGRKLIEESIDMYQELGKIQDDFRTTLEKFCKIVSDEHNGNPIIVMVDELDRCRPENVINILEHIKHLFKVKNLIFVLAIDESQLNNIITKMFGFENENCQNYLDKFFDLYYRLPKVSTINLIKSRLPRNLIHIPDSFSSLNLSRPEKVAIFIDILHMTNQQVYELKPREIDKKLQFFAMINNAQKPTLIEAIFLFSRIIFGANKRDSEFIRYIHNDNYSKIFEIKKNGHFFSISRPKHAINSPELTEVISAIFSNFRATTNIPAIEGTLRKNKDVMPFISSFINDLYSLELDADKICNWTNLLIPPQREMGKAQEN